MMKSNQLSVFHHHVTAFAKQRGIPIEKALAETRAMGFDGFAGDFAAEHFGHEDQESAMSRSAAFCRKVLALA